jgi:hypothetical protein
MPQAYRGPDQHGGESNAGRLSYVFAFGAAVFIISGNLGVAAVFGLMAVAAIAVAIRNLPPGGRRSQLSEPGTEPDQAPQASARRGGSGMP